MGHFSFRYRTREGQLKSFLVFTVLWNQVGWQCRAEFYDGARSAVASCEKNKGGESPFACDEAVFISYFSIWCLLWKPVGNETKAEAEVETTPVIEEALEEMSNKCKHQTRALCWSFCLCLNYSLSSCLCSKAWKLIRVEAAWRESLLEWCMRRRSCVRQKLKLKITKKYCTATC